MTFVFIVHLFLSLTVFCSSYSVYEEDRILSKKRFLISEAPYETLNKKGMGSVTLVFKPQEGRPKEDHTALVFEYSLEKTPGEISYALIHFGTEAEGCSGTCIGSKEAVWCNDSDEALKRTYRAIEEIKSSGVKKLVPPVYKKYASWHIDNDRLLKALDQVTQDQKNGYSGNCVKYATRIMKSVGLDGLDFGWWPTYPHNLRALVRDYVKPKPNRLF